MKNFVTLAAFAVGSNALVGRSDSCCFHLTSSGDASGSVGQLGDGQNRIGDNSLSPAQFCIDSSGSITDASGRGCILTPPTTQLQCDEGASPTPGFSVNSQGGLEFGGSTSFVACATGQNGGMNIYTSPNESDVTGCVNVQLTADTCSNSGSGSGGSSSSASAVPSSLGSSSASASAASTPAAQSSPATSAPASESTPGSGSGSGPSPSESAPALSGGGGGGSQPTGSAPSESPLSGSPVTVVNTITVTDCSCTASAPAGGAGGGGSGQQPSPSGGGGGSGSQPTGSASAPSGSQPSESATAPAPSGGGGGSQPSGSGSASVPASSASSTPTATGSDNSCPASLTTGAYETPHLIIPVDSSKPNAAAGTSYNGTVSSTISTAFNFDIPSSDSGKTCSLVFLFPQLQDLETSSFSFSGDGSIDFAQLSSAVDESTSFSNLPSVSQDFGDVTVSPGNSYTISTFACPAGQTVAFEMKNSGSTDLNFFEDWNPSPLGLFITTC